MDVKSSVLLLVLKNNSKAEGKWTSLGKEHYRFGTITDKDPLRSCHHPLERGYTGKVLCRGMVVGQAHNAARHWSQTA